MMAAIRLLLPYLRPYRGALAVAVVAMLGEIATAILAPVPVRLIFDHIIKPIRGKVRLDIHLHRQDLEQLLAFAALVIVIALIDALVSYVDLRQTARVAQRAVTDLRRSVFAHLQRLSLAFHHDRDTRVGDLQLRLSGDVQALQDLVGSSLSNLVTNGGTAIAMLVLLLLVERRIGLLVLAASVLVYVLARQYRTRSRQVAREARKQEGRISAMVVETLGATRLVQAFGREERESRRLHEETEVALNYGLRVAEYQARVQPLTTLATAVATAAVLLLGAILTMQQVITVGALTMVLAYTRTTFNALKQLAKLSTQTQKAAVGAERIREIMASQRTITDPSHPRTLSAGPIAISFEQVSFGYIAERPVIRGVTFEVPAGATAALVGPTGAGKSSLLSLVPRFYDVEAGSVKLGGIDVRELSLRELRSNVTLVLQETLLFRDTLWNNIAYGRPEASPAEVLAAAEAAGVTSFVDQLDDGFQAMVSERGTTLSGGQKQCVAIARALLRDTPVVLMDEPTSNLDAITEALVIRGIERLMQGRTAIIIAHRLRTIERVDLVAVLEQGRLVELGPPGELQGDDGLYGALAGQR
jgi:ABC-type multidrug transport system fused ATPase/permease subunit